MKKFNLVVFAILVVMGFGCTSKDTNDEQSPGKVEVVKEEVADEKSENQAKDEEILGENLASESQVKDFFSKLNDGKKEALGFLRFFQLANESFIIMVETSDGPKLLLDEYEAVLDPRISYGETYAYGAEFSSRARGISAYPNLGYDVKRVAVKKDGLWGFVEVLDGEVKAITECRFQNVSSFKEGLAAVCKNDKWGFINTEGKIAIEPQYKKVEDFYNKICIVEIFDNDDAQKIGAIDIEGNVLFEAIKEDTGWTKIFNFYEKNLALATSDFNYFDAINRDGEIVIENIFIDHAYGGPTNPYLNFNKDGLVGLTIFDKKLYEEIQSESKATYLAVFNTEGEMLFKTDRSDYEGINQFINEEEKISPKDSLPQEVTSKFNYIYDFIPGYFKAYNKGYYGIINENGETILPLKYNGINLIEGASLLLVRTDEDKGLINYEGWSLKETKGRNIERCKNGLVFEYQRTDKKANTPFNVVYRVWVRDFSGDELFSDLELYEPFEEDLI